MPFFIQKGGILKRNYQSGISKIYVVQHWGVECVLLTTADMGQGFFRAR